MKIQAEVTTITPQMAAEWISKTDESIQRKSNKGNTAYLASQIKEGKWKMNGEPIILNGSKGVLDGLHRLRAVVEENKSIQSLVVKGVDPKNIHTIDQGRARTMSDVISMHYDTNNHAAVAAALKFVFDFDSGRYGRAGSRSEYGRENLDTTDALQFLKNNPGFFKFIDEAVAQRNAGDKLVSQKVFCGLKWVTEEHAFEKAQAFFDKLSNGYGLGPKSPIAALRKRLIQERTAQHRLPGAALVRLLVMTFNNYCEGKQATFVRIPNNMPDIYKESE